MGEWTEGLKNGQGKKHGPTVASSKGSLLPETRTAMANVEASRVSRACVDMLTASLWAGNEDATVNVMCRPRPRAYLPFGAHKNIQLLNPRHNLFQPI